MHDRSQEKEWLDLGDAFYTPQEYTECLQQLDAIGRYLGGDQATFKAFDLLESPPTSILDVGCGGGQFTARLGKRYPQAKVLGSDISSEAINFAKTRPHPANVEFAVPVTPRLDYAAKSFDVITATLVCHHLTDDELVTFLEDAYRCASQAVIINDLHRHILASAGFSAVSALFFRNRLIRHDGLVSIRRAFTLSDWKNYLAAAKIPINKYSIRWHWAFRWIVHMDTR